MIWKNSGCGCQHLQKSLDNVSQPKSSANEAQVIFGQSVRIFFCVSDLTKHFSVRTMIWCSIFWSHFTNLRSSETLRWIHICQSIEDDSNQVCHRSLFQTGRPRGEKQVKWQGMPTMLVDVLFEENWNSASSIWYICKENCRGTIFLFSILSFAQVISLCSDSPLHPEESFQLCISPEKKAAKNRCETSMWRVPNPLNYLTCG